jgi:hypothetical protein
MDNLRQLQSAGRWPPQTPEQADQILKRKTAGKTEAVK